MRVLDEHHSKTSQFLIGKGPRGLFMYHWLKHHILSLKLCRRYTCNSAAVSRAFILLISEHHVNSGNSNITRRLISLESLDPLKFSAWAMFSRPQRASYLTLPQGEGEKA